MQKSMPALYYHMYNHFHHHHQCFSCCSSMLITMSNSMSKHTSKHTSRSMLSKIQFLILSSTIKHLLNHSQMSCFFCYHMHSHSFCHNYSYFLAFLAFSSVCLLDLSRKSHTLNQIMLNYCALTSMT